MPWASSNRNGVRWSGRPRKRADARQNVVHQARRARRVFRHRESVYGRAVSLARRRSHRLAECARSVGTDRRRRHDYGAAASRVSDPWRAVSSRVNHDARGSTPSAQFPQGGRSIVTANGISTVLDKLMRRENLSSDESAAAMAAIMSGDASPAQIASLLIGLTMKGERPAELVGLARTMRANAVKLSRQFEDVFDTCGTGGDRAGTFNISSAAALVVAGAGLTVAKHGNRSVSSQCGSADVYEALGVNVSAAPSVVEHSLTKAGIAFFFAPTFHPSMKHATPVRRELGVRTAFNLLGPLTNPAGARAQLVGVPHSELTE